MSRFYIVPMLLCVTQRLMVSNCHRMLCNWRAFRCRERSTAGCGRMMSQCDDALSFILEREGKDKRRRKRKIEAGGAEAGVGVGREDAQL